MNKVSSNGETSHMSVKRTEREPERQGLVCPIYFRMEKKTKESQNDGSEWEAVPGCGK